MKWLSLSMLLPMLLVSQVYAQSLDDQEEALRVITQTARDICDNIKLDGESQIITAEGEVKLELNKLLRWITESGISGNISVDSEEYTNMKLEHLGELVIEHPELLDQSNCRLTIFNDLKGDLLPTPATVEPEPQVIGAYHLCVGENSALCGADVWIHCVQRAKGVEAAHMSTFCQEKYGRGASYTLLGKRITAPGGECGWARQNFSCIVP